jgi:hypothetical protein
MDCRRSPIRSEKYPLSVDAEDVCAKLFGGVNFEPVHAEMVAALDGIAAGTRRCDFIGVPHVFVGQICRRPFARCSVWPPIVPVLTSIQF